MQCPNCGCEMGEEMGEMDGPFPEKAGAGMDPSALAGGPMKGQMPPEALQALMAALSGARR